MRLLPLLCLALCSSSILAAESDVLKVDKKKGWIKNNHLYEIKPGLKVGDEIGAKILGNKNYYLSFIEGKFGRAILEIRLGERESSTILHTSGCEGHGPGFKHLNTGTSGDIQDIQIWLTTDGIKVSLDGGVEETLKLSGCAFPWEDVTNLEFGGNCKKTYGNWRAFRIERPEDE